MCTVLPPSPTFSSISLYDQPFSRYCTFYDLPVDFHVKISKQHTYSEVWLKSDENWEMSRNFENGKIENFPKCTEWPPKSRDRASKVPYIWVNYWETEAILFLLPRPSSYFMHPHPLQVNWSQAQICVRFALRSAVFKILHILRFSHWLPS